MPATIRRYLELNQPFYPLKPDQNLKDRELVRVNEFYNYFSTATCACYPLRAGTSLGANLGLIKEKGTTGIGGAGRQARRVSSAGPDLAAVRQIVRITAARLNELEEELNHHFQAGPAARASLETA